MGAALAQRKDTSSTAAPAEETEKTMPRSRENVAPLSPSSAAAAKASREKRNRRRASRALAVHCLTPVKSKGECSVARGVDVAVTDPAVLASQVRRRRLMAQLTGEERDALLMREVLLQAHRVSSRAPSTLSVHSMSVHSDGAGSFDWCGGSATPSRCSTSSYLAAGFSGVVSVSSQGQSVQSDNGADARSFASGSASGSSWSLLSSLQLEPLTGAASGLGAPPAAEHERYASVLLMSDCESVDS